MLRDNRIAFRLGVILLVLSGIVLSMKNIREPDLWWQLRTGTYILENQQIPETDILSYSYEGTSWINVKWGYEVLQALTARLGGPEMLPLLQVFLTLLLLYILFVSIRVWGKKLQGPDYRPGFGGVLVLFLALVLLENRMTGRPEAVSHVMTAAFALLFILHRHTSTRLIWLLIPLQALWANLHEAYGMGVVLAGIFTGAAWFEYLYLKKRDWARSTSAQRKPWTITLVSILAFVAIAANPRGWIMLGHPVEIFSQLGENKYTIELYPFFVREYWNLRTVLALLAALFCLKFMAGSASPPASQKHKPPKPWQRVIMKVGTGYTLFFLAMLYLALSANRNLPFLVVAFVPMLGVAADRILHRQENPTRPSSVGLTILLVGVIIYVSVVSNLYYRVFNPRDRYGLEVHAEKTPIGAANFLKQHEIEGKAFTDFLCSSFLLWELRPHFKTYIDLRDLDIFPAIFFENNFKLYQFPDKVWPYADADMQFDYIVLLNEPVFQQLHRYLLTTPDFDLVYGDLLASVYLRKQGSHDDLIDSLGFRTNGHDVFQGLQRYPSSDQARFVTRFFNPFHQSQSLPPADDRAKNAYYQYLGYNPPLR